MARSALIGADAESRITRRSLKSMAVLSCLDEATVSAIEQRCRWMRYRGGAQIIRYQNPGADVSFVVRGRVKAIIYSKDGRAVTFREMGAGEMFGELSAIDGQRRSAAIEALEDCEIAILSAKDFWDLIQQHPEVARKLLIRLSGLVRMLSDRIYEFSTLAVRNRIQAELLRMARQLEPQAESVLILRPPSHAEIASRISTVREAVTREISLLIKSGVLRKEGRAIRVVSTSRLQEMVNRAIND